MLAESNSIGAPNIEQLRRDGIPVNGFTTTNATKSRIIQDLALAFERETLKFPNNPALIGELQAFESRTLQSGLIQYSAPDGGHDDCVMSLAIGYHGLQHAAGAYSMDPYEQARRREFGLRLQLGGCEALYDSGTGDYRDCPAPGEGTGEMPRRNRVRVRGYNFAPRPMTNCSGA